MVDDLPSAESRAAHAAGPHRARARARRRCLARAVALHPAGFAVIDPAPIARGGRARRAGARPGRGDARRAVYPPAASGWRGCARRSAATPMRARDARRLPLRAVARPGAGAARGGARRAAADRSRPACRLLWDRRFRCDPAPRGAGAGYDGRARRDGGRGARAHVIGDRNPLPRLVYPALPAIWDEAGSAGGAASARGIAQRQRVRRCWTVSAARFRCSAQALQLFNREGILCSGGGGIVAASACLPRRGTGCRERPQREQFRQESRPLDRHRAAACRAVQSVSRPRRTAGRNRRSPSPTS